MLGILAAHPTVARSADPDGTEAAAAQSLGFHSRLLVLVPAPVVASLQTQRRVNGVGEDLRNDGLALEVPRGEHFAG